MNKLHLLVMVTGLGLLLGVTPSWGAGSNPTVSDSGSNTAGGTNAFNGLNSGSSGGNNTAFGDQALENSAGNNNTGVGIFTLEANTANNNTALGAFALDSNTTGANNTASGNGALNHNNMGGNNTASGYFALFFNDGGNNNTASGVSALEKNNAGHDNTASGFGALAGNTTGTNNIAIGSGAGKNLTTGNNNVDIGSIGAAGESGTIRIGRPHVQTKTFAAGIVGVPVQGADVVINSAGQLGVMASSARFKHDIHDMGNASGRLMKLRPVTFRYKEDPTGTIQYGLVAEEVARVYPELVTYDADGKIETVRYSELTGMLVNELQRQNARQAEQFKKVSAEVAELKASRDHDRAAFEQRLSALEQTTQARNGGRKLAAAFAR